MNTNVEFLPRSTFRGFFPFDKWWRAVVWIIFVEAANIFVAFVFNVKISYDHLFFFFIGWLCMTAGLALLLPARLTVVNTERLAAIAALRNILEHPKYRLNYKILNSGLEWHPQSNLLFAFWDPVIRMIGTGGPINLVGPHVTLLSISKLLEAGI